MVTRSLIIVLGVLLSPFLAQGTPLATPRQKAPPPVSFRTEARPVVISSVIPRCSFLLDRKISVISSLVPFGKKRTRTNSDSRYSER